MKQFVMFVFAAFTALMLTQCVEAKSRLKLPKAPLSDVEVNGKKVGTARLTPDGLSDVATLSSGHRVSLEMKGGKPVLAKALDGTGKSVPASIHPNTEVAARTIVIV